MTHVHQLWRSMLCHWFSRPATKIFIASSELDAKRLHEIAEIYLAHKNSGAELELIYTSFKCDPKHGRNIADVKEEVLSKFNAIQQTWIAYKVSLLNQST